MTNLERFLKFESEHHLFDLEYQNIHFWHIIRLDIWWQIMKTNSITIDLNQDNRTLFEKLTFLKHGLKQKINESSKQTYDLLVFDAPMMRKLNNEIKNPYDYFLDDMTELRVKKLHHCPNNQNIPSTAWDTSALRSRLVLTKLHNKLSMYREEPLLKNLLNQINQVFPNAIPDIKIYEISIRNLIREFRIAKTYFYQLIKNRFKVVYLTAHYSFWQFALIAAAQELQLPTIEYQHGLIATDIPCYQTLSTSQYTYFPDYILTYSDYWNQQIQIPDPKQCITVGNPVIDDARQFYSSVQKEKNVIVFYSSFVYGKELYPIAIDLANNIPDEMTVIYKLHPNEFQRWEEWYPELKSSNVKVITGEYDTYELMARYFFHVGISSTALFEATAFNNKIFIFQVPFFSNMAKKLLDNPSIQSFDTSVQLKEMIFKSYEETNFGDPYFYYADHSFDKMRHTLHEILDSHNIKGDIPHGKSVHHC